MITLLVGLSQSANPRRAREYDFCFRQNLANDSVNRIIVFLEEAGSREIGALASDPRISTVDLKRRASYSDFLTEANRLRGVAVIANADVFFDWSIQKLNLMPEKTVFAITRTDCFHNLRSSDAWAFRPRLEVKGCDWALGRLGCETAFCNQVVRQLGWRLWNPCYEIRLTHVHGSNVRTAEHGKRVRYSDPFRPKVAVLNRGIKSFAATGDT